MILLVLFIILFSPLECFSSKLIESVVANLNDRAITYSEIMQEGELLNIENNVPPETPLSIELKEKILDLIMFRIILFEDAKSQGITVEENLVKKKVETYLSNVYMKDFLKKYELSLMDFTTLVKMRLITEKMTELFFEKRFRNKSPSQEEKSSAVVEWQKNLIKKQKLILYSLP